MSVATLLSEIEVPTYTTLTQGTIFTCAALREYCDSEVYGIIISARCDVANDKLRVYNYLPIVPLRDWMRRDGAVIVSETLRATSTGNMKRILKEAGYSPAVLETESADSILKSLFPTQNNAKHIKQLRQRFESALQQRTIADAILDQHDTDNPLCQTDKDARDISTDLLSKLMTHKQSGYYFLPVREFDGATKGFVVMLRHVESLSRQLAHAIVKGVEQSEYDRICEHDSSMLGKLALSNGATALPVGQLTSPLLEHLMQTFSLLFSRIGIRDIPEPLKETVVQLTLAQKEM